MPEHRRPSTPARNSIESTMGILENVKSQDHHHHWPAARIKQSNILTKSLDCSTQKDFFSTVQCLWQAKLFDDSTGRASFDGAEFSASSDTDSISSGSNSGTPEFNLSRQTRVTSRGVNVSPRFWQETSSRLRRLPGTPSSSLDPRNSATTNVGSLRRTSVDNPFLSPCQPAAHVIPSSSSTCGKPHAPPAPSLLSLTQPP